MSGGNKMQARMEDKTDETVLKQAGSEGNRCNRYSVNPCRQGCSLSSRREHGDDLTAQSGLDGDDGQMNNINSGDVEIQPCAIAYKGEDHIGCMGISPEETPIKEPSEVTDTASDNNYDRSFNLTGCISTTRQQNEDGENTDLKSGAESENEEQITVSPDDEIIEPYAIAYLWSNPAYGEAGCISMHQDDAADTVAHIKDAAALSSSHDTSTNTARCSSAGHNYYNVDTSDPAEDNNDIPDSRQHLNASPPNPEDGAHPPNPENGAHSPNPENVNGANTENIIGAHPPNPESGAQPPNPENGSHPSNPENGAHPSNPENGTHPSNPENGAQPPNPENGAQPPNPEYGAQPPNPENGALPPDPEKALDPTKQEACASTPKADPTTTTVQHSSTMQTTTLTSTSEKIMSTHQTTMPFDTTRPEPEVNAKFSTPTSSTHKESRDGIVNSPTEKVTFGGKGKGRGKFKKARGVAVSDNEIFVADVGNRRVQVFSMSGLFLRLFPAVVPAAGVKGKAMRPSDVAIDGKGYVWVVGSKVESKSKHGYVVKYSKEGQPKHNPNHLLKDANGKSPSVAFDAKNNKVIVAADIKIYIFSPDGSLHKSFNVKKRAVAFITSDNKGNKFVTEETGSRVQVYSHDGRWLSRFGGDGKGKGKLNSPQDICTDNSGHIIIANWLNDRVDMFTSSGKFVRTVVEVQAPWGIAVGPGGDLVVVGSNDYTITIFPRHMVSL
ncbi:TRIM3 [Branchiostoma lanceolatum]|uniref:TRIM3 protein n=1 Tax=Branchiostoma lanceolatum TaxID=7740 RepID=A0A8J9YUT8_BRALA|nr:TRIM3 [Branchiostoma lanceolatum]